MKGLTHEGTNKKYWFFIIGPNVPFDCFAPFISFNGFVGLALGAKLHKALPSKEKLILLESSLLGRRRAESK